MKFGFLLSFRHCNFFGDTLELSLLFSNGSSLLWSKFESNFQTSSIVKEPNLCLNLIDSTISFSVIVQAREISLREN